MDRSALDRIVGAGGYISMNVGAAPDANAIPIGKAIADTAFDAAACIQCGACVAACKNASAALFTSAKIDAPQPAASGPGRAARDARCAWSSRWTSKGFGACSNEGECEAVCPKEIKISNIAKMNRDYLKAQLVAR